MNRIFRNDTLNRKIYKSKKIKLDKASLVLNLNALRRLFEFICINHFLEDIDFMQDITNFYSTQ